MEKELTLIEEINAKGRITVEDLNILKKLNEKTGTYYLENDIIKIEYHSLLEKYKAEQLLKILEKNPNFYKTFLEGKEKISFSNEEINDDKLIKIESYEFETKINHDMFLKKMLESQGKNGILIATDIKEKLEGKKSLVTKDEKIQLLKKKLLEGIKEQGQIDFFDYLDLMNGIGINENVYLRKLTTDIAFNYDYYVILKRIIQNTDDTEMKELIYYLLYKECALDLLNEQLDFQNRKINKDGKRDFLVENLIPLSTFFATKLPDVIEKYKQTEIKQTKALTREEIIKETVEILKDIDPSNNLLKEFEENISNGRIILWNSKDTEKRKQMYQKYHKNFNIDEALCFSKIENNKITDNVVNIPLNYTVDDIPIIIHEMMHLNSALKNPIAERSEDIVEFASIYFEEYAKNKLMEKGYTKEELYSSRNERITNTLQLYKIVSPTIFWLNQYQQNGNLKFEEIDKIVRSEWNTVFDECQKRNYNQQTTNDILAEFGLAANINESTDKQIGALNQLLIRYNTSIFKGYKYILGTILAQQAMEKQIDKKTILSISNNLNNIENPLDALIVLGIDTQKYGFEGKKEELENTTHKSK